MALVCGFLCLFLLVPAWFAWKASEMDWVCWWGFWSLANGLGAAHMIWTGFEYAWGLMPNPG